MADFDRRIELASDTRRHERDNSGGADSVERLAEDPLIDRMIRVPTDADFDDVLSPEGNSGDIIGSGVSDSTTVDASSVTGGGL